MGFIRTAHDAELNAAEKMREMGYDDAEAMPVGPDGGIDVKSSRGVAQVKWRGGQTGSPEVQNLFGARGTSSSVDMLFFSAAGYSRSAKQCADQLGVMLFGYEPDGTLFAENDRAAVVLDGASTKLDNGYAVHSEQGTFVWRGAEDSAVYAERQSRQAAENEERFRQGKINAARRQREVKGRTTPPDYILNRQATRGVT